ncbi:MAG: T9SS type A sorting domain-containing protein [Ginsengibacter sp.]
MKKFTLFIGMLCISAVALPQACPIVVDASFTASGAGSSLSVTYTGNGAKHIEYFIYCDGIEAARGCFDTKGDGTQVSPPVSCSGVLGWVLVPGTGTCINGTTCGDTVRSPEGGPLPVVLGNFLVQRKSSNVTLSWQTQQEINLKSFEIQRATGSTSYVTVGKVAGHGTTSNLQNYTFTDNANTSKAVSFYRLKIVDIDGKVSYTSIKSVKGSGVLASFIVFPNPSFGHAKITITDLSEPTDVRVIDNAGRLIKSITLTNTNSVEISNLQQGGYIVQITGKNSGETVVRKLTVIK